MFKFLKAARSLVNQGMSKEAIEQFAKQEFGEINELFQKQIDNLFKQKQGIENIKIKDEVFDDTVIKLPIDDMGAPFNPKDPMKQYGKPKKSKKMTDVEEAIDNASPGFAGDRKYDAQLVADDLADKRFGKEFYDLDEIDQMELYDEAYQGLSKQRFKQQQNLEKQFNKDVEEAGGMEAFLNANPISEKPTFRLNKERFKKDFNVTDEEVEKISLLSPEDQQKKVKEYIDKDFKEQIELSDYDVTDLEPNAEGGIVGYYTGGMVDVEPNLSDIGHGSDALMARTRLVAPDGQATTSTGLNYLLAEDNDNIRVPFAGGYGVKDHQAYIKQIESELHAHFKKYKKMGGTMKFNQYAPKFRKENYAEGGRIGFSKGKLADAARRKFMKTAGAAGAGIAALKTGLLGFGEKAAPVVQKAVETVSETAQGVPPYFLNLVNKIRKMGESTLATKDKANAYKFKDYVMEEDFAGNIEIIKKERGGFREDVYMSYKVDDVPIKGKKGSTKVEEYEEYTARPDQDGKMKDVEQGVPDEVVQEGTMFEDDYTDFGKADGGRIGFAGGKLAINAGRKFLEKVFGKERFATMIDNDPRMEQGMLEVVDMFRKKDKKGLKMYLQKYLPHMDDAEIEDFIIGSDGTEGITGQLIRLGSGREYESLMDLKKQSDQMRKLEDFNIEGVSKNAEGGRIGLFLGGGLTYGKGLLREMLKFMSKDGSHKKSPAEILKMMNPKQYEKLLNNPKYQGQVSSEAPEGLDKIIQDMIGKTKTERSDMINDIISASRNIKKVDDDILNYKLKIIEDMVSKGIDREIAVEAAENISKEVAKNAGKKASPNITDQGLLELENIQKNLVTKDRRKLQAQGGLTTMLGE